MGLQVGEAHTTCGQDSEGEEDEGPGEEKRLRVWVMAPSYTG